MKTITILSLVLALALISVQPVQATSINYTVRGVLVKAASDPIDSLGLGNSTGTVEASFTVTPPPIFSEHIEGYIGFARYALSDVTVTLSGTPVTVLIHPEFCPECPAIGLENFFNYNDDFDFSIPFKKSGVEYIFSAAFLLSKSFWSDAEIPPLPKPVSLAEATPSWGQVTRSFGNPPNDFYLVNINYLATLPPSLVPLPATVWFLVPGLGSLGGYSTLASLSSD